jgi:hypothetical protein
VFLNGVNLVTKHVSGVGVYWEEDSEENSEENSRKFLLNNFPVLGKLGFKAQVIWTSSGIETTHDTFWHGNFPLNFSAGATCSVVVEALGATGNETSLAIYNNSSWSWIGGNFNDPYNAVNVKIKSFTGWAWEVIGI